LLGSFGAAPSVEVIRSIIGEHEKADGVPIVSVAEPMEEAPHNHTEYNTDPAVSVVAVMMMTTSSQALGPHVSIAGNHNPPNS